MNSRLMRPSPAVRGGHGGYHAASRSKSMGDGRLADLTRLRAVAMTGSSRFHLFGRQVTAPPYAENVPDGLGLGGSGEPIEP